MSTAAWPTTSTYARYLADCVLSDLDDGEHRLFNADPTELTCWADLHDYCDANEYLLCADDWFGLEVDYGNDDHATFHNLAVEQAEWLLWPTDESLKPAA